jgi:DNA-binding MarR family transcriptional regulator
MLLRVGRILEPQVYDGMQVSFSEICALGELDEAGTMSQQELAALLGLEKSTVSRLTAGLERKGWLSRERDAANRRFHRLVLTPEGRNATERLGRLFTDTHATLFSALTPDERSGLSLGLSGLVRALQDYEHEQAREPATPERP